MSITEKEIKEMILDEIPDFIRNKKDEIYDDEFVLYFEKRKVHESDVTFFHNRLKLVIYDALDNYKYFIQCLLSKHSHALEESKKVDRILKDIMTFIDMIDVQYEMIKKEFVKL